MVTVDDVRAVLARLPRSSEVLVRDRVKFRVGQIVYVAFSQDETEIGFAFPKEERAALVAARPDVFFLPRESELRFHWIEAWLDALDADEMRELVLDAWRMVVPQRVAREVLGPPAAGHEPGRTGLQSRTRSRRTGPTAEPLRGHATRPSTLPAAPTPTTHRLDLTPDESTSTTTPSVLTRGTYDHAPTPKAQWCRPGHNASRTSWPRGHPRRSSVRP